jgi:hypothetical protein
MEVYSYDGNAVRILINKQYLQTQNVNGFKQYLSQNPITVQYELATPIVRKLGFTTKGNYREQVLDGSETWAMDAIDNNKTVRLAKKTTSPLQNPLYNTVLFTDDYHVRASGENHGTYEYITCIGNGIYINIYQSKVNELSVQGCTQWLSQNPIKVGYITSTQSSESYSNIHKPIFFNDVNVQYLPNNVDIQPELTYQVRTRNSYVMDMMKANTKYSVKLLLNTGEFVPTIDGINNPLVNGRTFTSPSTLTNKLLITPCIKELMIIEGDVTGKNLPYFKGILSSYHDVDEIELYSVNKNLFDIKGSVNEQYDFMYDIPVKGGKNYVKDNVIYCVDDAQNNYGSGQKIKCKPNTTYCISFHSENLGRVGIHLLNKANAAIRKESTFLYTTPNDCYEFLITFYRNGREDNSTHIIRNLQIEESSTSTPYIPHSHNTALIEMPTRLETVKVVRPVMEKGCILNNNGTAADSPTEKRLPFIPVQPGETLTFRNGNDYRPMNTHFYDMDKNFIKYVYTNGTGDLIIPDNCYFIRGFCRETNTSDLAITRQAYKPIQLNSLPNGVCDEIIMKPNSNKAQLVQRVGKVVLDGSEDWLEGGWNFNDIIEMEMELSNCVGFNNNMMCESIKPVIFDNLWQQGSKNVKRKESITIFDHNKRLIVALNSSKFSSDNINDKKIYLQQNPITVYYELATPIIHEIQLKGYPHVYENGTVTLNTDTPHQTLVSYNVNQEQLINTQNETIIRHDQQIDDLYYYIEMYLEEIYQMELFRMKLELSL